MIYLLHSRKIKTTFVCSLLTATCLFANNVYARGFTESYEILRTPGVGFQEGISHKPYFTEGECEIEDNSENLDAAGVKSGSKYVRLLWQDIEPSDNNFTAAQNTIDEILRCAGKEGKSVDLRIHMAWPAFPTDHNWRFGWSDQKQRSVGLPRWLVDKPGMYPYKVTEGSNVGFYYLANWNDWMLRKQHEELITWLGQYDGHKYLNSIDIGSVGFFGEWHNDIGNRLPDYLLPTSDQQVAIIKLYQREFPNTPKVGLEEPYFKGYSGESGGAGDYMRQQTDIGWRGDSWGSEYHTTRYNNQQGYLGSTWKTAPIHTEITGPDMAVWENDSYRATTSNSITNGVSNFETLTNYAANWHVSLINSKGGPLHVNQYAAARKLARKLGFRFVLNEATHANAISAGSDLNVEMKWNNKGVAPQYRDFRVAFRLRDSSNNVASGSTITSSTSVKGWLPNQQQIKNVVYKVPASIPSGNYTLEAGLVFHSASDVVLPIAVTQRRSDYWVPLEPLTINAGGTGNPVYFANVVAGGNDRRSESSIWRLTDGQIDFNNNYGSWSNNGDADRAYVNLYMNTWRKVTAVKFSDRFPRRIHVGVFNNNGNTVWSGVFNTTGRQTKTINIPNQWGTRVSVWADRSSSDTLWFTPYEIQVFAAD